MEIRKKLDGKDWNFTIGAAAYIGFKAWLPMFYEVKETWLPVDDNTPSGSEIVATGDGEEYKTHTYRFRHSAKNHATLLGLVGEDNHPATDWLALYKASDPDVIYELLFTEVLPALLALFQERAQS